LLNPDLDTRSLARRFAEKGRVRIDSALRPEVAELLGETLEKRVPWSLTFRDDHGERKLAESDWQAMDADARQRLSEQILELARRGFQFRYRSYMMITAYLNNQDLDLPLHRVVELLNRRDWLEPMARIIDQPNLVKANCQASLYRPGDFLSIHNDWSDSENRRAAYVINLSRDWSADQGGLLQFFDNDGEVVETFVPRFNSISLFRTPALHCVTPVANFANGSRCAITGWLLK